MVRKITTKPNTFYVKKNLDNDVGITPVYGDAYEGLGATYDLDSNPKTTYLIGESTIVTPNDYVYGDGNINEMYISTYVNSLTQTNPQTAPFVDVYNMKANIDLTEGNMTIISGETGLISTFSSWYNFGLPWLLEDFDGTEKHLFNVAKRVAPQSMVGEYWVYKITFKDALKILKELWEDKMDEDDDDDGFLGTGYGPSLTGLLDDAGETIKGKWNDLKVNLFTGNWTVGGDAGLVPDWDRDTELLDSLMTLKKNKSGRYKLDLSSHISSAGTTWGWGHYNDVASKTASIGWWIKRGAFRVETNMIVMGGQRKTNFGEDYLRKATSNNTIFSDIFGDSDVRDVKVMKTEKPGDNQYFLAYGYSNLITADSYSAEQALQVKLYWENYSGATWGELPCNIANPFGRHSPNVTWPLTQDLVMSIHGIPQPYSYDLSRPGFSGSAFAPELEIIFKINKMDVAPIINDYMPGSGGTALERSFNIIGGATAPTGDERVIGDYVGGRPGGTGPVGEFWVTFINTGSYIDGNSMIDVIGNNWSTAYTSGTTRNAYSKTYYRSDKMNNISGTVWHTQIPTQKWITARIKFMQRSTGGGYDLMMYFPEEFDSNGQMKFIEIRNSTSWASEGGISDLAEWFNHLTLWINNMRSMNIASGAAIMLDTNWGYAADKVIDDDKQVDIIIDSIGFYGWNVEVHNSTVAMANGTGDLIKMPSAYATPQAVSDVTGTGVPDGPVKISSENYNNIYGKMTAPIATYFSIGYESSSWDPSNYQDEYSPATGSLFTEGHNLLFNDFATKSPESLRPITLISGAHFGNQPFGYPGNAQQWFNPGGPDSGSGSTIVGSGTDVNIRLSEFDNSVDRFTQKGLITISGTISPSGGFSRWARTGNPYASAKILNVEENGMVITVDNPAIFNMPEETEYVIEQWPNPMAYYNTPYSYVFNGRNSMGYQGAGGKYLSGTAARITAKKIGGARIQLNRSVLSTDYGDGTGTGDGLSGSSIIEYNIANPSFGLTQYIISPYKYWIVMAMLDVSGSDATSWGGWWQKIAQTGSVGATATMTLDNLSLIASDSRFSLSGTAGTDLITYTFDTTSEGDIDDTTTIGIKNDTAGDVIEQMVYCINNVNTLSGSGITAGGSGGDTVTLTQTVAGPGGNTTIANGNLGEGWLAVGGMTFGASGVSATASGTLTNWGLIATDDTFTLRNAINTDEIIYTFNTSVSSSASDETDVNIDGLGSNAAVAAHIAVCVNNVNASSGSGITAASRAGVAPDYIVYFTQTSQGPAGHTLIDSTITGGLTFPAAFGLGGDEGTAGVNGVFTGGTGNSTDARYPLDVVENANVARMPARNYTNLVGVSGGSTEGTTYNETIFTDGIYANRWSLSLWDVNNSMINLKTDFGYGAIETDEEAMAVSSDGGIGYMGRDYLASGQNYINISNYVGVTNPKDGADFNFLMKPTYDDSDLARYSLNINTDDASTNPLQVLYGLKDMVPPIGNFEVSPALEPKRLENATTDVQAGDSNVVFTWKEENNDTWYRLLFVDNKNISNKYHNINYWAPLNEVGATDISIPDYGYYTSQTDTAATSFSNSGSVQSDVEGFTGYGAKFDGTDDYLIGASHTFASAASRWSFIVHCKPSDASGGIVDVWDTTSKFKIEISSNRIKVTESGSSKTLTSVNSYDADGFQPLAIVVTFDKDVKDNNWKLIVNGKLEDTEDYTSAISIAGTVFIGASGTGDATTGANFFTGFIEEITSYEETTVYIPPNENNYLLNTSGYPDLTTGSTNTSLFYTGRLFVMDYHNIRGKGPHDVGRTDMASWKVTGI